MLHIFIINPYAGSGDFSAALREQLSKQPNLQYFIFNIRYADYEKVLVNQILKYFDEDKLRIYVCGGLGTFHKVLNALDGHLDDIEMAWYPMGTNNNLLRLFKDDIEKFRDIQALIEGDCVPIDYIRTDHGLAINAFSLGVDAKFIDTAQRFSLLNKLSSKLVASISLINSVFFSNAITMKIKMNDYDKELTTSELFFGNGEFLGSGVKLAYDAAIDDGLANYLICPGETGFKLLHVLAIVQSQKRDRVEATCELGHTSKMHISGVNDICVNLDGEKYAGFEEWDVELIPKGIKFVIPKEVTLP